MYSRTRLNSVLKLQNAQLILLENIALFTVSWLLAKDVISLMGSLSSSHMLPYIATWNEWRHAPRQLVDFSLCFRLIFHLFEWFPVWVCQFELLFSCLLYRLRECVDFQRSYKAIRTGRNEESRDEVGIRADSTRSVEWSAKHSDSDKYQNCHHRRQTRWKHELPCRCLRVRRCQESLQVRDNTG